MAAFGSEVILGWRHVGQALLCFYEKSTGVATFLSQKEKRKKKKKVFLNMGA